MTAPRIGVTTSARSGWRIFPLIALSVRLAGGRPVWWRVGHPAETDGVDGLIVGGGDDISASLYDGKVIAEAKVDPARDALEQRVIADALSAGKPVLGICRGAQMINIAHGGSLHQNIYESYRDAERHWTVLPRKDVRVVEGTLLERIIGPEPARVNALHTQSVDRIGAGLRASACERSGIVQAVEGTEPDHFVLGVQWHPEHLFYARRQRALFRALIAAADAARGGANQPDAALEAVDMAA